MNTLEQLTQKIQTWEQIALTVAQWRAAGERIVFTNGCFDLLHYGHLHYLAQARDLGERLIIGLNDADSVRRLKGAHRPINDEATRQTQLAALSFVDAVVSFSQDTPLELIERVQPDILVKGGDYVLENIVGAEFVLASGGVVRTLPFVSGYSTTNIEAKIKEGE
jgi:D-glycero-beta-D-manno-heptose 1-phosphate adenylyltransferase